MKSDKLQDHIDEIMDYFDFERVHKMMKAVNWEWRLDGVPDVPDMRKLARGYLQDVWNLAGDKEYMCTGSGGFVAVCHQDEEGKYLELRFEASSWETSE